MTGDDGMLVSNTTYGVRKQVSDHETTLLFDAIRWPIMTTEEDSIVTADAAAGDDLDLRLPYQVGGASFAGLLVRRAAGSTARGGVMIAPDWRGLSPFVRHEAARLAEDGYDVAVVDLYGGGLFATQESQAGPLISGLIDDRRSGVSRMGSCLEAFRSATGVASVVLLGYSIGGMVSLDFARSGADIDGVALCSALLKPADPGAPTKVSAPVLALHGTGDVVCPMTMVAELSAEMDEAGNDATIILYTGTHHAFYNPEVGTDPTARLVYSATADARSRESIDTFLAQTLR
ncbi:dienelactone hydrolase family protein [Nocardia tengchongensis]|uniref:dienelactone hydrolase family protein n=1 Tax=Nocardia tengchongensis TaxID=2055889 RepID=UPI0036C82D78